MKSAIVIGIACLLPAVPAFSADASGEFAIKGAGQKTCQGFLTALEEQSPDVALYGGWIEGYVTGVNQFQDGLFDLTAWQTTETLLSLMRSVCVQVDAETRFLDAFYELVSRSRQASLSNHSDASVLSNDGRSVIVYRDVLAMAKERLSSAGYDTQRGSADFGPQEIAAFEAYQRDNGLPLSGLPDQQTLFSLFMVQ